MVGYTKVSLGFQAIKHPNHNLKFYLREVIPTGNYDELNVPLIGTDATGKGSYTTALSINYEHKAYLPNNQPLLVFTSMTLQYLHPLELESLSVYGGGPLTRGKMWSGNLFLANAALEYLPFEKLGFVVQARYLTQHRSRFNATGPSSSIGTASKAVCIIWRTV